MIISSGTPNSQLDKSLNEAAKFVQSTLDALSAHIAILDETGCIIGTNAAWRKFADDNGFKQPDYGIGVNYLAVCDNAASRNSKDAPVVALGIREIMSGKLDEFEMEYPCHSPTQRRWFVVRISRFTWYDQPRFIVAHQNVTELKRSQIELGESKHRIEAILDNVNNGILTVDLYGHVETANRAALSLFGYTLDEIKGININALLAESIDHQSLKQLDGKYGHEMVGVRKDQSRFPVHVALNTLQIDDGHLYTCIVQDMTVRKRMENEIIERERVTVALDKERELREVKNHFLSMMGHELKTPLAQISLASDMLRKYGDVAPEEDRVQYLDTIQAQVKHLDAIVQDVLTLSRNESGSIEIDRQDTDIITYCRDVVEEYQFSYHRTHEVEFTCDERTLRASIDRKLLRRALTNLLSNAIKYSPEGGRVDFMLKVEDDNAVISVTDRGIGIPEADQARLFEPFHRANNVNDLPGTGLGLAITRQVVEMHGGTISYDTKSGSGTTFYICIPLTQN